MTAGCRVETVGYRDSGAGQGGPRTPAIKRGFGREAVAGFRQETSGGNRFHSKYVGLGCSASAVADYAATKAAIAGYVKGAARDLRGRNITVKGQLRRVS